MTTKRQAQQLASHGRNGDTLLVHMSRSEFDALNTGLGSLTGSGATINPETGLPEMFKWTSLIPAVVGIGASVLSGGTLSPLAAGMMSGAATAAATGDWRQGVMGGITGMATAGLGAGASEMMGAGAAGAGTGAVTQAVADPMAGFAMQAGADGVGQAALDASAQSMLDTGMNAGLGGLSSGATFNEAFMGDKFMGRTLPGVLALGNSVMGGMEPEQPDFDTDDSEAPTSYRTMHREYTPADPSYTVTGGEPQMFGDPTYTEHEFAQGGLASLQGDGDMVSTKRARQLRARYRSRKAVLDDLNRPGSFATELGITGPTDPILDVAFGFTKKQGKKNPTLSPAFAGGGHVQGEGDGMEDAIMTSIEGEEPAALSNDEYVIPADAVSDIGNGSSQAGAQELDTMVARIRAARHGTTEQPPAIDPRKMMPA